MAHALALDTGDDTGPLTDFGLVSLAAAAILASVLIWAAVAKLRDPTTTTTDFAALGLPRPRTLASVVPGAELSVAGLLLVIPGWGGVAAFGLLALFSAVLVGAIHRGSGASCACFGGSSREPVSARHLLRNASLGILALVAVPFPGSTVALL